METLTMVNKKRLYNNIIRCIEHNYMALLEISDGSSLERCRIDFGIVKCLFMCECNRPVVCYRPVVCICD